jgi:hypothetical protein
MKTQLMIPVMALLMLASCSEPCVSVCERYNSCTVADHDHIFDCPNFCGNVREHEKAAGADSCKAEFETHLSCWQTNLADICNPDSTVCVASGTAWIDCLTTFCAKEENASSKACQAGDPTPVPSFVPF